MTRAIQPQSQTAGLAPGTVVHVGDKRAAATRVSLMTYDEAGLAETTLDGAACLEIKPGPAVTWIDVVGVGDTDAIARLGECLHLHPLVIEDIANTDQRVKVEDFTDYLYLVAKLVYWDHDRDELAAEQVSIILGDHFVVSFQEAEPDAFDPVKERLRNDKGRLRKMGADYLAYALLDAIVDSFFEAVEQLDERIEGLEDELVTAPDSDTLREIHRLKWQMILFRKAAWPMREVVGALERHDSPLICETTEVYLRDVYDHTVQVIDAIEALRDLVSGMLDIYLSSVSNRMNAVMKVLTIIATIFIPLTFLAGVYGMNFAYLPEKDWRWGYPAFWVVCLASAVLMLIWFRRKKWI